MKVCLIYEDNHGLIGVALNYYHAVRWLIENNWIDEHTEHYSNYYDEWREIQFVLGKDWADQMMDEWDIERFNEEWAESFYLESVEVNGSEMD